MSKEDRIPTRASLFSKAREDGVGMDPKSILIGDRLRHTVYNGALLVPPTSLKLIHEKSITPHEEKDFLIDLPSVDSVKRPTLDNAPISVTYLRQEKTLTPSSEEGGQPISAMRTVATNHIWNNGLVPDTDRLRGGGEGPNEAEPSAAADSVNNKSSEEMNKANPNTTGDNRVGVNVANPVVGASRPGSDGIFNHENNGNNIPTNAGSLQTSVGQSASLPQYTGIASGKSATSVSATAVPQPTAVQTFAGGMMNNTNDANMQATGSTTGTSKMNASEANLQANESFTNQTGQVISSGSMQPAISSSQKPLLAEESVNQGRKPTYVAAAGTSNSVAPPQVTSSTAQHPKNASLPSSAVAHKTSAQPAAAVGSSSSTNPVVALSETPEPQYNQHIPGPNDEMQVEIKCSRPKWYRSNDVSELERTMLPEWFDKSAQHRTKETYIKAREHVLKMSGQLGNRFISTTLLRRTISGDVGSLNRLLQFLSSYSLINADAINDSTPTTTALRPGKKRRLASKLQSKLATIVSKGYKPDQPIDWQSVANEIGDGTSASDCRKAFLSTNFDEVKSFPVAEPSSNPVPSADSFEGIGESNLKQILSNVDENVLQATINTALSQSQGLEEARQASIAAVMTSAAASKAQSEELALSQILSQLNEKRMQRLEKRIELLDDVEGMMEAERMALELERRDLYTARCRQWFGGGS